MGKVNLEKHIWEGWRVVDFITELQPSANMIQNRRSWQKPFQSRDEVKKWCMENQPYYKKYIPDVVNYFCQLYSITN